MITSWQLHRLKLYELIWSILFLTKSFYSQYILHIGVLCACNVVSGWTGRGWHWDFVSNQRVAFCIQMCYFSAFTVYSRARTKLEFSGIYIKWTMFFPLISWHEEIRLLILNENLGLLLRVDGIVIFPLVFGLLFFFVLLRHGTRTLDIILIRVLKDRIRIKNNAIFGDLNDLNSCSKSSLNIDHLFSRSNHRSNVPSIVSRLGVFLRLWLAQTRGASGRNVWQTTFVASNMEGGRNVRFFARITVLVIHVEDN
jgi:hypothetical protein